MSYSIGITVDQPFDRVLEDVRDALSENGFGVITEIDIAATLKNKLGVDVAPQIILGACSPSHAYRALQAEPSIGLLLPCNVVVRESAEGIEVEAVNPQMLVELSANAQMCAVADEVTDRLRATLHRVAAKSQ